MKTPGFNPADFVMGVSFRKTPGASWVVMGGHCRDVMGHCRDVMGYCRDVMGHCRDVISHCRDVMGQLKKSREKIQNRGAILNFFEFVRAESSSSVQEFRVSCL